MQNGHFSDLDIDECDSAGVCHENATCTNTVGSFACTCNDGYAGDGFSCSGKSVGYLLLQ